MPRRGIGGGHLNGDHSRGEMNDDIGARIAQQAANGVGPRCLFDS
ncbi:MAG TPA: hypothetical protein VJL59_17225 [Anaerolineales bacterium]|nr:hypothetical protein [Anaerolineales bacterium]